MTRRKALLLAVLWSVLLLTVIGLGVGWQRAELPEGDALAEVVRSELGYEGGSLNSLLRKWWERARAKAIATRGWELRVTRHPLKGYFVVDAALKWTGAHQESFVEECLVVARPVGPLTRLRRRLGAATSAYELSAEAFLAG